MKRAFDIIVSVFGLLFLIPLFLFIGILIKTNDKGSVFFTQERIGKNRKPFLLIKFRSMSVLNAAKKGIFEPGNSSRVTRIGKFLRRTKLDELPQLFNVLKGDMSLVGPRPEVKEWVEIYPERWTLVLSVKPGITDNASIMFKNEEEILSKSDDPERIYKEKILPQKLDLYEYYVANNSFLSDFKLIFKTLFDVILKR